MREVILNNKIICKHLNKTVVDSVSPSLIIDEDAIIKDINGELVAIYKSNFFNERTVVDSIYSLPFQHSDRLSGVGSDSLIFGNSPRDYIKKHPCRAVPFNRRHKKEYFYLYKMAKMAGDFFLSARPDEYKQHLNAMSLINKSWIIADTIFSSGIINKSNQLIYHTDNGNVKKCYSSMFSFRKGIDGGWLHLPEYDCIIKNDHGSLLIFDGAKVLHGVTPFSLLRKESIRCTIVFYSLQGMAKCCCDQKSELDYHNKKLSEKFYDKKQ